MHQGMHQHVENALGITLGPHNEGTEDAPGRCQGHAPLPILGGCLMDAWWILRYACPPSYVCGSVPVLCADWLGMGRHTYDDEERCCFLYVLLLHVVLFFLVA